MNSGREKCWRAAIAGGGAGGEQNGYPRRLRQRPAGLHAGLAERPARPETPARSGWRNRRRSCDVRRFEGAWMQGRHPHPWQGHGCRAHRHQRRRKTPPWRHFRHCPPGLSGLRGSMGSLPEAEEHATEAPTRLTAPPNSATGYARPCRHALLLHANASLRWRHAIPPTSALVLNYHGSIRHGKCKRALYQRPKLLTRQGGFPSAPFCHSMLPALIRGGGDGSGSDYSNGYECR